MLNQVHLMGHLGQDPEVRKTPAGRRYAKLSMATTRRWRDQDGNRQERTEWHRVVIWSAPLVEIAEKYLRKGSKLWLAGSLATRAWTDDRGVDREVTEVVLQDIGHRIELLDGRKPAAPEPEHEDGYGRAPADDFADA
jgi:single-strand DNA-binding protein